MQHLSRKRTAAFVLAFGLIAAACNDGGGGAEPTEDDTGAASEPAESEPAAGGEITTDVGVTEEACPKAVNPDNGCIYLGIISDLTVGPFAPLAVPITDAQGAFWRTVNEDGGIGGYDIDVETYTRDNQYNPEVHNQVYQEIKPEVLGLAQTLGSPTTAAIIEDLVASNVVAAPASWTSAWAFQDVIIESGANYCIESMNAVDYALEQNPDIKTVLAVAYPGDYGADGAAGAKIAAEANGLEFTHVEQTPIGLGGTTAAAVQAITEQSPDLVILTMAPTETAEIIGGAAANGYQGQFIGTSPTWNPALLASPAADAIKAMYLQSGPWASYEADTPGHNAMREALGDDVEGNGGYVSGWAWSYPLKAALEQAAENGDLTREGVLAAVKQLESVDYQGMLPEGAGNFAGDPNEGLVRSSVISEPDDSVSSGTSLVQDFFTGPTAEGFELKDGPCFETVDLG